MKSLVLSWSLAALVLSAPLSASAATTSSTEGGSTQVGAQEGCMNQWMFNGMWRVKVTNVVWQPKNNDTFFNAWLVTMQWANGTSIADIGPNYTLKQSLVLALANGDTIDANNLTTTAGIQGKLDFHSFPPSGQFTYTQPFGSNDPLDPNNKPAKLLVMFNVKEYQRTHPGGGQYWTQKTPAYNFRIKLDCSK